MDGVETIEWKIVVHQIQNAEMPVAIIRFVIFFNIHVEPYQNPMDQIAKIPMYVQLKINVTMVHVWEKP